MATYIQRGETLDYLNTTGGTIKLGDIVKLGTRAGVAGDDIPAGEIGAVHVTGRRRGDQDQSRADRSAGLRGSGGAGGGCYLPCAPVRLRRLA